ncbi:sugar ABC transporter permease [Longispora fulva]|uniref:ABC-type sugar transport system permease subunit n=1 Tax=Longispora fulva TaxID=619741 RepID=A0A8J7KDI0_9ACTN|nr:sugar ABC transporter permease [Longispora fulva]MBG6134040.1 ABC-type sugar transport system permease subunit [Longispora fulva]GIG63558.1 sugar ABC transporter permease [Longispora fulva]
MNSRNAPVTAAVGGARPVRARHATSPRRRRRGSFVGVAALFLAPLLLIYAVYYLYAFGFLAKTSTTRSTLSFGDATDVGWENFRLVLTDEVFWRSVANNLLFAAVSIAVALTLGFFLAVVLSSGVRLRRFFYAVFLLPSLIPLSLFATVFGRMLETRDGAVNATLRTVGLGSLAQDWLGEEGPAYAALFVLLVYLIGLPIMYYTSDLATANTTILESALLDGANTRQMYRLILFPLLRNTHKTVILSVLLGSFRAFDVVFFSTKGDPGGRTGITGTYVYNAMLGEGRVGYASAAAVLVLVIALLVSLIHLLAQRRGR